MHPCQRFIYCPKCGAEAFEAASEKHLVCKACGFEYYINAAGAVAAVIVNEKGELLVVVRARDPDKGMLDLPGGFIDPGERAEDAVDRELHEELGVEVVSRQFLTTDVNSYTYKEVTYQTLDLFWLCTVASTEVICAADDVESYQWIALQDIDLDHIAFSSIRRVIAQLQQGKLSYPSKP